MSSYFSVASFTIDGLHDRSSLLRSLCFVGAEDATPRMATCKYICTFWSLDIYRSGHAWLMYERIERHQISCLNNSRTASIDDIKFPVVEHG